MQILLVGLVIFLGGLFSFVGASSEVERQDCDIVVVGGSTSSLAAAFGAAEASNLTEVCFLELTDWPGGQLTSSAVSAIDYGTYNRPTTPDYMANLPKSFQYLLKTFPIYSGACWVSDTCFLPGDLIDEFVFPHLKGHSNIRTWLNTAVIKTTTNSNRVESVLAVQRTAQPGVDPWGVPTSEMLDDWFVATNSSRFSKKLIEFHGKIFIEASEFGDLLRSSSLGFAVGLEAPLENSTNYINCGQATTIDFFMNRTSPAPANPVRPPPGCPSCSTSPEPCCNYYIVREPDVDDWEKIWTYRRVVVNGSHSAEAANVGDVSMQNWGAQDYPEFLFFPPNTSSPSGMNLTRLAEAESRARGWFYYFLGNMTSSVASEMQWMLREGSGTAGGLAKLPYLRDSRRSPLGIENFRLESAQMNGVPPPNAPPNPSKYPGKAGYKFHDVIGIGDYFYLDTHVGSCPDPLPSYLKNDTLIPYYFPFRSLTHANASNLLVAGKSIAQSFHANSGTRLHPEEWVTGSAAGVAATLMIQNNLNTTLDMYNNIHLLQEKLTQLGQPLEWSGL